MGIGVAGVATASLDEHELIADLAAHWAPAEIA